MRDPITYIKEEHPFGCTVTFAVMAMLVISGIPGLFTDNNKALVALETAGYTQVSIEEKATFLIFFRGGGVGDAARYKVQAKNPIGRKVTTYVFAGWPFKGATIRTL